MEQVLVALLAAVLKSGGESRLEVVVEEMRAVANQLSCVALVSQNSCNVIWSALIERLPAVMRPPKNSTSHIGSVRNRRKTACKETFNACRAFIDKCVQHGGVDWTFCIVEQIVESKCISYYENYVLHR